jgi:hypothetical protein
MAAPRGKRVRRSRSPRMIQGSAAAVVASEARKIHTKSSR